MIARFASNPLLMRQRRCPTKVKVRSALKYGFGFGLVTTFFSVVWFLITTQDDQITLLLLLFCLAVACVAPCVAYAAVKVTSDDMSRRQFEVLHVTPMSEERLVEGYVLSTLYSCRGLFSLIIGLTPVAATWAAYISIYDSGWSCATTNVTICERISYPFYPLSSLMAFIALCVSLVGICILSAAVGVLLAAFWRNRFLSSIGAVILTFMMSFTFGWVLVNSDMAEFFQSHLIWLPVPYLLYGLAILMAPSLVREGYSHSP